MLDKRDCLNSDGRRLLNRLLRILVESHPQHRRLAAETRRNPCIDQLARLARLTFYTCDPREAHLAARGVLTPYKLFPSPWSTPP